MQYDLTNNITSIGVKGSAIFGVFTDKNLSILAKYLDSSDIAKIKEIVTKTSFEGKVDQSICIYDSSKKNLEKIYLVGMGEKNKYSEKTFLKVINCFSAVCKKENIKNIFLVVDSLISKELIRIGQLEIFHFKLMVLTIFILKQKIKLSKKLLTRQAN